MADGTLLVARDVTALPHGHDAWVVGDVRRTSRSDV